MKEHIIELIQQKDHKKILDWAKELSDKDRYASLDILMKLDSDEIITEPRPKQFNQEYADKHHLVRRIKGYMTICCIRSAKDLSLTVPDLAWDKSDSAIHSCFRDSAFDVKPLVEYFNLFPPDYLDKIVAKNAKERQFNNNFRILWSLYKNGWITFDEETFVRSLFIIPMFRRKPMDDVQFLSENKEAISKVLLQFYKYEIPILDISKWNGKTEFHCAKCTEYWDEVFSELLSINLLDDRSIIKNLLGTLSYNWKKAHLDWHIRMIKLFNPTKEEYLTNQDLLLAALYSTSNSVCNYVINTVESLYKDKQFDAETFLQNVPSLFVKEKADKAISSALDIVSYLLENKKDLQKQADIIADALVQPNDQIQEKAAQLLVQFIDKNNLEQVVEPFASSLKQKARDILHVEKAETETSTILILDNYPLTYPASWEDFLFHIGKTLGSQDASDIDIMYESFIQLQDQMPDDYVSQLKPFTKKLEKASSEKELLVYIAEFFDNWLSGKNKYKPSDQFYSYKEHPIPFLRNRNQWVLSKLKRKSKLPLLSTPTHFPFYIHPEILVSRLIEYEKAGGTVELEDLIVACNRILKTTLSDETKKQALKLKGNYAKALHHLLGLSTEMVLRQIS